MPVRHKNRDRPWDEIVKMKRSASKEESAKFYNHSAWRATSAEFLARNEWCQCPDCDERERQGKDRLIADMTDHVIPIDMGGDPWNEDNFQAMNKRICHQRKRGRERHGLIETFRRGPNGLIPARARKHIKRYL